MTDGVRRGGREDQGVAGCDLGRRGGPQAAVEDDTQGMRTGMVRKTHSQFGIVGQHSLDADQDGVMRRAQAVALLARLRPGDPLAFARGRGDAAVQRGGQLQSDARAHQSWPDLVSSKPSSPRNLAKSLVWRKSL